MKKISALTLFFILFGTAGLFAAGEDTLILLDGKIITGSIQDESMEVLNNLQGDINTWHTMIQQGADKPIKVQNKDINYFIINGISYGNRHLVMGNKFVRIIAEGQASLYGRAGTVTHHHTHTDNTSNPMYSITTTTEEKVHLDEYVELVIKGKKTPYSYNIPYIKSHFAKIFVNCDKLQEESKKEGFDFNDLVGIVQKYNACF